MKLRFYAKDDLLVTVPGSRPLTGEAPRYVGRDFVRGEKGAPASFPASHEPFECDSESPVGMALARRVRLETERHNAQPLWPADEATAGLCGVTFRKVQIKDGVAVPNGVETLTAASASAEIAALEASDTAARAASAAAKPATDIQFPARLAELNAVVAPELETNPEAHDHHEETDTEASH